MFSWANKQLEYLAETMAPMSASTPSHRFISFLAKHDEAQALKCLNGPFDDANPPLDPHGPLNTVKGCQAIHLACQHGAVQVISSLLNQHGARVDTFDYQGNTALHYAVKFHGGGSSGMSPVALVKMLVNDYKASVTVKNAQGQTPYDVSTDTMVRQYLLPLQLQQETQACFDQGGQGLPPGIDMGGYHMSSNIAPPPTSSTSVPQMNDVPVNNSYESSINSLMAPPPMGRSSSSAASNNTTNTYLSPPPPPSPSMMTTVPLTPRDSVDSPNTPGTPATQAQFPPPPMSTSTSIPPTSQTYENLNVSPEDVNSPPPESTPDVTSGLEPVNESHPDVNAIPSPTPATTPTLTPAPEPTPTEVSDMNVAELTNATQSMSFQPPPISTSSNEISNTIETSTFPQKPYSSSPALPVKQQQDSLQQIQTQIPPPVPPRTLIKPDGFHSSSSDPNLQQKYGHIKKKITIDPPPTNVMMPPPPRPYASTSSLQNNLTNSSYGGSTIQNRYLAYDAVTGQASSLQQKFPPPPPPYSSNFGSATRNSTRPGNSSTNGVGAGAGAATVRNGVLGPPPKFSVFNPAGGSSQN